MEEDTTLVTREQYVEILIDDSLREASKKMWRTQGYDETSIRLRIESAQITRSFHRGLKEQGLTMLEIREELRKTYGDHPELYDLARERERLHPGLLRYRGNTGDLPATLYIARPAL